jgi:hypothetical protein
MNKKVRLVIELVIVGIIIAFIFSWFVQCHQELKRPNNSVILKEKTNIVDYQKTIDSLELELVENSKEVLDLQNRLQLAETNFSNFKKSPKYKDRKIEIIKTIPIDSLASNTIELEHCIETNQYKDSAIVVLENYIDLNEVQKEKYKNIIEIQNKIENQLNENILHEINETKKANRKANYWKIASGTLAGLIIYDKIK